MDGLGGERLKENLPRSGEYGGSAGLEPVNQDIRVFSRRRIELTGIEEVESFTENAIVLLSKLGSVSIEGEGLKIESFSTEKGELVILGKMDSLYYFGGETKEKQGFFSRLMR